MFNKDNQINKLCFTVNSKFPTILDNKITLLLRDENIVQYFQYFHIAVYRLFTNPKEYHPLFTNRTWCILNTKFQYNPRALNDSHLSNWKGVVFVSIVRAYIHLVHLPTTGHTATVKQYETSRPLRYKILSAYVWTLRQENRN